MKEYVCVLKIEFINENDFNWINPIKTRNPHPFFGIKISKLKKKRIELFLLILDWIWRHGQAVRQGTANPLSPVQIWVSPFQQDTFNFFYILLIKFDKFLSCITRDKEFLDTLFFEFLVRENRKTCPVKFKKRKEWI